MDPKEFLFVTAFTAIMGVCWFFAAGFIQDQQTKHTTEYLCNRRAAKIRYFLPGCQYVPAGNVNGRDVMEQYSSGNRYVRSLGYMTFSGKYESFQIDDALTEYDTKDSDLPDDYYESLLFRYPIPAGSPVYGLDYLRIRRVSRTKALFSKAVTSAKDSIVNRMDGPETGRTKYFPIGKSGIEAAIPPGPNQDKWFLLLFQGLSERIDALFRMYGNASHIEIVFDHDSLLLCVSISLGHDRCFDEKKDFLIQNTTLISRTMEEVEYLCSQMNLNC
ncbi:MAG: hypothetical protein ACI4FY_03080 [Acetatifactor sp.]